MRELPAPVIALLGERRIAALATIDSDGTIHQTAVWYLLEGDRILVPTVSSYRKVANVRRHGTASVLVDTRSAAEMRGVAVSGRATVLTGEEALDINRRIHARYLTPAARADPVLGPLFAEGDDVTIAVSCDAVRYWDMADGVLAALFSRDDYLEPPAE